MLTTNRRILARALEVGLLFFVLGAMPACSSHSGGEGSPCASDASCLEGLVCIDGICVVDPCADVSCGEGLVCALGTCHLQSCEDRLCPEGLLCLDGDCVTPTCVGVTCESEYACADGHCYPTACVHMDCGAGVCVDGQCVPRSCVGVTCPEGEACGLGECHPVDCTSPCAQGEVCVGGVCTEASCVGIRCGDGQLCGRGLCWSVMCEDENCGPGEVCVNGACTAMPCVGVICPDGQTCEDGACVVESGTRRGGFGQPCHEDETCYEPYVCNSGFCRAQGTEFIISPAMSPEQAYTTIEAAEAGDVVTLLPGVYQFRVYIANSGTSESPIVIRGSDPHDPPIFDYEGKDCDEWPGSNSGRLHYWAWQIQGSHITIENLVIRHARMATMTRSSAGVFLGPETIYAEPTPVDTIPFGITLQNITIHGCDEGLQGTAEGTLVERCEIFDNGTLNSNNARHNVYLQGGSATFRFCYIYDASTGANFTLRTREARVEYSRLGAFVASHSIQVLTNKAQQRSGETHRQVITLIGNELSGTRNHTNGMSKFLILINSNLYVGNQMHANLYFNTYAGASGNSGAIVQLAWEDGTQNLGAHLYNNVFFNNEFPIRINLGEVITSEPYDVDVRNNWWPAGDYSAWESVMVGNVFGGDPTEGAIGQANQSLGELPEYEPLGEQRSTTTDLGAHRLE